MSQITHFEKLLFVAEETFIGSWWYQRIHPVIVINEELSFLHTLLKHNNEKISALVYRKPGILTNSYTIALTTKDVFFSIWVSLHEHSRFPGRQEKGEAIFVTPLYQFHPLHRYLNISWAITAESSPLHIANSQTRTRNHWLPKASQ